MNGSIRILTAMLSSVTAVSSQGQGGTPVESTQLTRGELSVVFRDNSKSPEILSGIDSLVNVKYAPDFDAFDPDTEGASAGLNFEHIISGHKTPNNKFTPRHGPYRLITRPDGKSVTLVRRATDSPWSVDSTLTYTIVEPNYVDFEFRCTPRDASRFGRHGYAIFFFANYMNDVVDPALHFRGRVAPGSPEQWIPANAPPGHADWNGGGNYRSQFADQLGYDDDVQFRLNTWSYDWPRISKPFYYGIADHGMTFILMFDRLYSKRDQVRFSLYKFKLPKHPRPAWDFQYVINRVKSNEQYGFSGRLIWKKFVSAEDCLKEFDQWTQTLQAARVQQLRKLGATVFTRGDTVIEVNANGTAIADEKLDWIAGFSKMTDLSLEGTQVSDAGISHLQSHRKLEWLNLYRCPVGNESLETLKEVNSLQHLPIGNSKVSDAGLHHLSKMSQLVYLGLRGNNITDDGLQHVGQLTNLNGLHLGETQVTDKGLTHLRELQKLQRLWLDDTSVSDAGIEHLFKLRSLRELHIGRTKITAEGINRLRRSLPRCKIEMADE